MLPKIIVILGPTASGKTSMGIELAREFNGEIISVDSRQIYKGMDIGTAKEPGEWTELDGEPVLMIDGVAHWGIDLVNPNQDMTVAEFKQYADNKIEEISLRDKLPILVGGTGFWAQTIVDNVDIPAVEPDFTFRKMHEQKTAEELFELYKEKDPAGAEIIDRMNKVRLIRALEVCMKTGQPFSKQQRKGKPQYDALQLAIEVDREVLYDRINGRVEQMIEQGLVEEVKALEEKYGSVPIAMTGIGYRQIVGYIEALRKTDSESSFAKATEDDLLAKAVEKIKKDTRNYAKRQVSWFGRDERIKWVKDVEQARELVSKFI